MMLSFAPGKENVETYTYGTPGCYDLVTGSKVANALGVPHREILFDNIFVADLPTLMYETVWLSGGMQGINRSTLLYVYRFLSDYGRRFPVVLTGVSGDHFFRGHGNVPAIISANMEIAFKTGNRDFDKSFFHEMFRSDLEDFFEHINNIMTWLIDEYGHLSSTQTHLNYLVYEVSRKLFGGETAIADCYSTFRAPYCDPKIVQLAYDIEFSTLSFSRFASSKKDHYRSKVLQAYLISKNKKISSIPIHGIGVDVFAMNNAFVYQVFRGIKGGMNLIKKWTNPSVEAPLEDWGLWHKKTMRGELDRLLSHDCELSNYIDADFITQTRVTNNIHWVGKLATAEIVLRLIRTGWRLPSVYTRAG